jgi:hypothetical protein
MIVKEFKGIVGRQELLISFTSKQGKTSLSGLEVVTE